MQDPCVKTMIRIATTNGFAILVAVSLLFTPISRCAAMTAPSTAAAPSRCPGHPTPEPKDCAKPGCVCLAINPAANTFLATGDQSLILTLPAGTGDRFQQDRGPDLTAVEHDLFSPRHRFLAIHQFRI